MLALMETYGPPVFYNSIFPPSKSNTPSTNDTNERAIVEVDDPNAAVNQLKEPSNCFQSLCRIVAGQQLAGSAAQAIWVRLLETSHPNLTPTTILTLAQQGLETHLQKPAGLSQAKAKALVDLAQHFEQEHLTDEFFSSSSEEEIREALLRVKGIGPWSCDMFLLFYLERPNVFPMGDFGVRKGLAKHFGLGSSKKGLSATKDAERMKQLVEPYQPYLSLFTYYMWKAAATNIELYDEDKKSAKKNNTPAEKKTKRKEEIDAKESPRPRKKQQRGDATNMDLQEKGNADNKAVAGEKEESNLKRQSPRLRKKAQTNVASAVVTP
jgi:3-methyladenine DNA glycosylase/8-oxoguanine DNA glycosylase